MPALKIWLSQRVELQARHAPLIGARRLDILLLAHSAVGGRVQCRCAGRVCRGQCRVAALDTQGFRVLVFREGP